ncbi:hypothetical protein BTA51_13305 [Hahella sp. CCB-MM4]|uniref:DUF799 domain-containing protein n=1 Tax=Hahella sp. (strain CCB-MM4) TaxID=1926491 RepID=UPI000B9B961A|nr:GNA1162 family protein [Hahella sp. CCB-MM4]OZG72932.1 hypothetical protein BTA51_13305 [Hahella sp. CCB-MM4]
MKLPSLSQLKYLSLMVFVLVTGCAVQPYDYTALQEAKPRSILVIPPVNNTVEVSAPYTFLSTISAPLAEKGYYVFPVAVIDQFMKQNGLPTPMEMNQVPLEKIREIIGPDAVLYVTIEDWGQQYNVISSKAVVSSSWRLVDARTGELLWEGVAHEEESSNDGGNDLSKALLSAVVHQIVSTISDKTPELSRRANYYTVNNQYRGLLPGPYYKSEPQ